jgi:uncharacterized protein (TIGR03086 family)
MSGATGNVVRVADGVGLLERAIGYALGSVHGISNDELSLPTPCRGWDLRMLLRHVNDSFAALQEAVDGGRVALTGAAVQGDPVAAFRVAAVRLLGSWARIPSDDRPVSVGGCAMATSTVTATGALEIAVHGWDIGRARGRHRPLPEALAVELLHVSQRLLTNRAGLFDPPVPVDDSVGPSALLIAHLGRHP